MTDQSPRPDPADRDGAGDEPSAEQVRELMRPMVQRTIKEMGFDVLPPRIRENSPFLGEFSLVDLLEIARSNRAEAIAGGRLAEAELWATAERQLAGYVRFLEEMGRDPTRKIDTHKYLERQRQAENGPRTEDQGRRTKDEGPRTKDQGPGAGDGGLSAEG